ncbi:MAG: acyl carrier protein [Thermoanaerobaculia bacterium]
MRDVSAEMRDLVASVLDVPPETVDPARAWEEYEDLESFALVELLVAVQEKFGVRFQPRELSGVRTMADLAKAVERKLGA